MICLSDAKVRRTIRRSAYRAYPKIARKCRILLTPDGFALGFDRLGLARIVTEEIVLQNDRNAQQHLGIDASAFEDVVDVGPLAVEFPREPAHRPFLPPEFRLDQFADMYHRRRTMKESADKFRIHVRGIGRPL